MSGCLRANSQLDGERRSGRAVLDRSLLATSSVVCRLDTRGILSPTRVVPSSCAAEFGPSVIWRLSLDAGMLPCVGKCGEEALLSVAAR